ncbi:MAG: hypothetical protein AB7F43_02015 [Bacteriovoracia bacterium]
MENRIAKIGISDAADQALDKMLMQVNDGFQGGRVSKNDLASWALLAFEKHYLKEHIEAIRKDHFDKVAYLQSVVNQLKAAKKSGTTVEVSELLAPLSSEIKNISARKKPRANQSEIEENSA